MAFSTPVGLSWDSPPPPTESVRTDGRTDVRMYGRTDGRSRDYYVTTKISRIDKLPNFLSNGAPLAGFARRLRYKVDMKATNSSTNLLKPECTRLTDDEHASVGFFLTVLSIIVNLLTGPLVILLNALFITAMRKKLSSDHAQYTVGLYDSNRSGGGDRLSAGFRRTRDFPGGRWIIICILQGLVHTKDDNKLPLPSVSSSLSPYRRGTFCCDEIFTAIRSILSKFRLTVAVACCWIIMILYWATWLFYKMLIARLIFVIASF